MFLGVRQNEARYRIASPVDRYYRKTDRREMYEKN
jgi:hypothetical protein